MTPVELRILSRPLRLARLAAIRARIYAKAAPLEAEIAVSNEPISFAERPVEAMRPIRPGEGWGGAYACAWFRLRGVAPEIPGGSRLVALIDLGGEGLAVDGLGRAVEGLSSRSSFVELLQAAPGKRVLELGPSTAASGRGIELWIEAGYNGGSFPPFGSSRFGGASLASRDDGIAALYYDFLALAFASACCRDPARRGEIDAALDSAWRAARGWGRAEVGAARAVLSDAMRGTSSESGGGSACRFTALGHSHLDMAWLWPIRETRRKAARTFATALRNLDRHPDFVYGASQAQQFAWIKEERPQLYSRIKEAVSGGRFELQGGMWVESDANLPSGESLVRQFLYGERFFEAEFGRRTRMCWLPDAFGFNANMPQILRKCGMDYFMTIKLTWNETNDFPYRSFVWTGLDGSSVLAHMPPEGDYNSGGSPASVALALERYPERETAGEALLVFGAGDGGGGPGEAHIELVRRQRELSGFPKVEFGRAEDFFVRLASRAESLPRHSGELYLEKHQGTYTTQGRTKRANRRIEFLLHEVECLCSAAWLRGAPYPSSFLERTWKEALLYQFHDILPGSSVGRVYEESLARYAELGRELEAAAAAAALVLADTSTAPGADSAAGPGAGVEIANLAPFDRAGYSKAGDRWIRYEVPAYASARASPAEGPFPVAFGEDYLENDRLRVTFSPEGHIVSVHDKAASAEAIAGYANKLVLYSDPWRFYNAWDISRSYRSLPRKALRPFLTDAFADGPRVVRKSLYQHGRTTIAQDVILEAGSGIVEFDTSCDWHEKFRMLRADFEPAVFPATARCDIQFGSVERSTREDDPVSKAMFEICAHKWVDLSEGGRGLALLNDCKYGHRVKEGLLSLNLLRSPVYPDPRADRGEHRFRYALYPHAGDAFSGGVPREGYLFNIAARPLPPRRSLPALAAVRPRNVVLETIKKAEDEEALVLRLYECGGEAVAARVELGFGPAEVLETDMLERPIGPADPERLFFAPFEVKTLLVRPDRRL